MKQLLNLIAAPTAIQPGNYVPAAYADAVQPVTPQLELSAIQTGESWEIHTQWRCPTPSADVTGQTDRFADALALFVPTQEHANWMTMGSADAPVEGVLWRADREGFWRIDAQGLGTMQRSNAPATWRVKHQFANGVYSLRWLFPKWENLSRFKRCAVAVWQGDQKQRAGLKSVSAGWVVLNG